MKKFLVAAICLISLNAQAGFLLELGGTYLSDNLTTDEKKTSAKYFYNVGLLFSLKKRIWAGWNYSGISHTYKDDVTVDYTSADTGPYVKWQFGRNELYSLSMAYNILSTATYANGVEREKWSGNSLWLQAGVMPELKEGLHLGISLNYFVANYSKKTVNGDETSTSNSKSWVFPTLNLTKEW